MLEKIIRDALVKHMSSNDLFSDVQHGFISGKSCVTQLLEYMEDLTEAVDSGCDVDVIYLDFCKAFDKVPHKRLLMKLYAYGVRGRLYRWIREFLKDRQQRVVVCGSASDWQSVTSGIPQGSVLGPILFLIFINDLPDAINCCIKLFADDAKIYAQVNSIEQGKDLQGNIKRAEEWASTWEMFFNEKKCKQLHIGTKDMGITYKMYKNNSETVVEKADTEKDLGVVFDSKLLFREHIASKIKIANRNLGLIFRSFTYMDKEMFLQLYKSIVRPHLEYASSVWSPHVKKDKIALENVQRRATRLVKSLFGQTYSQRLRALGLPSLE